MRRTTASFLIALVSATAVLTSGGYATANKLDLSIARFVTCYDPTHCVADIAAYETFLAEYAFGISPKIMSPASTLGYSGFYLGLEGTVTPVPASSSWDTGTADQGWKPGAMFFPAIHVRKGLPWSMEIGSSISYLSQSELVGLGGEVKWSIFEGYRHRFRGALPDVAARGSVVRILGESDVDMTIVGVDGSISYSFGVGGMISLTPYAGFQYLWAFIRTEPMVYRDDEGKYTDWPVDGSRFKTNTTGEFDVSSLSGPNLERMKLFLGLQFKYELLSIIIEGSWGLAQSWDTAVLPADDPSYPDDMPFDPDQATTDVGHQFQFTGGVGLDF